MIPSLGEPNQTSLTDGSRMARSVTINDTIIKNNTVYEDEIIYLNGNLTIDLGGSLKLINSTLYVNKGPTDDKAFKIIVRETGKLELLDESAIQKSIVSNGFELEFLKDSIGNIENSEILSCGYLSKNGLLVQSDDVTFVNSKLSNNYIGINCVNASPEIIDCEIINSYQTGIVCDNSSLKIIDSIIAFSFESDLMLINNSKVTLLNTLPAGVPNIYDSSELIIAWRLTINVTNGTDPILDAAVSIKDVFGTEVFSGQTDENGSVKDIECIDYISNSTDDESHTPYTITVTKDGYKSRTLKIDKLGKDTWKNVTLELLPPEGTITGYVKDDSNNPLDGANVSLEVDGELYWDHTDATGRYTIQVPGGENYTVTAEAKIDNISAYELGVVDNISVYPDKITWSNFTVTEKELPVEIEVVSRNNPINILKTDIVDIDTQFKINFEHPINFSSLKESFSLNLGDFTILGNLSALDTDTWRSFVFSITGELIIDETYHIIIKKELTRLDTGKPVFWKNYFVEFNTDFDPITETNPSGTSVSVENPDIYCRFDSRIELEHDYLNSSFVLLDEQGDPVSGSVEVKFNLNRAIFKPNQPLNGNEKYTAVLVDDLRDAKDNLILHRVGQYTWSFTTEIVVLKVDIIGRLIDKETGEPISLATITIKNMNDTTIDTGNSNKTGYFKIYDLDPGFYKIEITQKDYKTYKADLDLTSLESQIELGDFQLSEKEEADEDEGFVFDAASLVILGILILIIIFIIIFLAFRKPAEREVYEEAEGAAEVGAGEGVSTAPARARTPPPAYTTTPPTTISQMQYVEKAEAPVVSSIYRCPNCMHRITSTGECFHCQMREKYGLW
jgi:hypothetical protein